ncbi:hypothetical protein ACHAXS_002615 [Conticribra weissflogii]
MSNNIFSTDSPTRHHPDWCAFAVPRSKTGGLPDGKNLFQQSDAKLSPSDFSPSTIFAINDLNGVFRITGESQQMAKSPKVKNKQYCSLSFMTDDELSTFSDDDDDDTDAVLINTSSTSLVSRRPQTIFRSIGIKRSYECLSDAEDGCSSPGVSRANPISCIEDSLGGSNSSHRPCVKLSALSKRPRHEQASCTSPLFVTDSLSYRLSSEGMGKMLSFSSKDLRHPLSLKSLVSSSEEFSEAD